MSNPASQTAIGPMVIAAVEQYTAAERRILNDQYAYQLLPQRVQRIVRWARWGLLRKLLIDTSERSARGLWASMLCRKRYIDDMLLGAIDQIDSVVILGTGLDTRAYRLPQLASKQIYEVDLPENIAYKRRTLHEQNIAVPANVQFVPIDFEQQNLGDVLAEAGYGSEQRTFFIWEAVTQYLHETSIRRTFETLAQAAPGSRMVFTYVRQDFIDGSASYNAEQIYKRFRVQNSLWHFGMLPGQIGPFLETYGWREIEQMGSQEYEQRYVTPTGRGMPVTDLERAVYAEKS